MKVKGRIEWYMGYGWRYVLTHNLIRIGSKWYVLKSTARQGAKCISKKLNLEIIWEE